MSKAHDTVWISRKDGYKQCYHTEDDCHNIPPEKRELERNQAECTYRPCGRCVDDVEASTKQSSYEYECYHCGSTRTINVRGARTVYACDECEDVTQHDRC